MAKYTVRIDKKAAKELKKLPLETQKDIQKTIDELADNPRPHGYIKLKGQAYYQLVPSLLESYGLFC